MIRLKDVERITSDDAKRLIFSIDLLRYCAELLEENRDLLTTELLTHLFKKVKSFSKIDDLYCEDKRRLNDLCRRVRESLSKYLEELSSDDKLKTAVKAAVVGNALDMVMVERAPDVEELLNEIKRAKLAIDDSAVLREVEDKKILYLLDNNGEALLDSVLAEELRRRGANVIGVVKEAPFQDDVYKNDEIISELEKSFTKIISSGSSGGSILLEEVKEDFRKELETADLLISKGIANFEYLEAVRDEIRKPMLYMFKVKCELLSKALGVPIGSYVVKLRK